MELGIFGSVASFDSTLSLTTGHGAGGRAGMFFNSRLGIEFEMAEMRASRPNGLMPVNVGILAGRLVAVPVKAGAVSLIIGGGAGVSTETNFLHSYGVDVLAGARIALNENAAVRFDGVWDWLSDQNWKTYKSARVGLSLFRNPAHAARTQIAPASPPLVTGRADPVPAAETRRLLPSTPNRDSLRVTPIRPTIPATDKGFAMMSATIYFSRDRSELTNATRNRLDEEIVAFRTNPAISIIVLGGPAEAVSGSSLANRRAQALKDYIVKNGIAAGRITIRSSGKREDVSSSMGWLTGQEIFSFLIAPNAIERSR